MSLGLGSCSGHFQALKHAPCPTPSCPIMPHNKIDRHTGAWMGMLGTKYARIHGSERIREDIARKNPTA